MNQSFRSRYILFVKLLFESIRFAAQALRANLLRTLLSLLGVTIGIFAIIAVYTVVDSLERSIRESMAFLGDRVIYVQKWPWGFDSDYPWWKYIKRPFPDTKEFQFLQKNLEYQAGVAMFAARGNNVLKYKNNSVEGVILQGVTYEFDRVSDVRMASGRYFAEIETVASRDVAILGADVAADVFGNEDPIGKNIKVKGRGFTVIGVLEKQGENLLGMPSNDKVCIIPYGVCLKLFTVGRRGVMPSIAIKGREDDPGMMNLENEIRGLMRSARGLKPSQDDDFSLNRPEMLANVITSTFDVIRNAGTYIGLFSILVGGFGIANIMFVSVKERTNIIGIQKSLGAKNYFILLQFLFEAVFLSFIGGALGMFLVWIITFVPLGSLEIILSLKNVAIGFFISACIGILAGIIPAVSASRLDPVIAIRSK